MKKRDYKEFATGNFYHVYNRGNNKEKVFIDEQDYKIFLFRIGLSLGFEPEKLVNHPMTSVPYSRIRISDASRSNFKLHAFCLMPNHFHLLIEQCKDESISKLIAKTCTSYSMYINKKYKRVGHVFQDCFKANLVEDDPQLMWTSAYIHMNPVKDGFVTTPSDYKWSSYNDFVSDRNLLITHTDFLNSLFSKENFAKETIYLTKDD